MKTRIHAIAGTFALLCVAGFWTATAIAEIWLSATDIAVVKQTVLRCMWLLIPALMITGGSGFSLAGRQIDPTVEAKKRRMRIAAANGLFVLLPAAWFLCAKAEIGNFDASFAVVQGLELLAGGLNIGLLGLNLRDGLRISRRRMLRVSSS